MKRAKQRKTSIVWFHLYVSSQNKTKETEQNKDQRDGYHKRRGGGMSEKGEGNIGNNIVISLHGDR